MEATAGQGRTIEIEIQTDRKRGGRIREIVLKNKSKILTNKNKLNQKEQEIVMNIPKRNRNR